MPLQEALENAREKTLDLVEVAPEADPPVCRAMDYGRHLYRQKKRTHQSGKKQHIQHIKEVRLRPKTERHDLETKLRHARRFLEHNDKVLVSMWFKGREMSHMDLGRELLQSFVTALEDVAKVEQAPKQQGRRVGLLLTPK